MSHNPRKPDACDMLAEALKQMDSLLSDTSHAPPLPQNGHISKLSTHEHNGRPSLDGGVWSSTVNGSGGGANTPTTGDGSLARRLQASKALGLCAELRVTLAKVEDRAMFLLHLPGETRKFLQQWFSEMEKDGIADQSDGGMSPRVLDNMKMDLVVENNRLRLRLSRMERELQSLEDKFSAAQRRISDLHSSLNERTIEVTGLTSRLARTAHTSPDRSAQHELEKLKRVVELLKIADNEKNSRIEELKRALSKYKQMEEVLVQLKKSQILENIRLGQDVNVEEIRSSGEEDGDSLLNNKTTGDSNNSPSDEALQDPAVHLRSLSAPRLMAATHQALAISASLPLSSLNNFGDSSSSYDNLASYTTKALAAAKKENFGSHDALIANGSVVEPPSPVSPSEKRPPLPPHSTASASGQAGITQRRQNRVFASVGKGILKSQGNRWSRSTPSLLVSTTSNTPKVEEGKVEAKKDDGEEEEKDKPGSRSQTPTRIQTRKTQSSGLKKFFDKIKRRSQDLDDRLEDFKRSPLRSTVGARLGLSEEIYDVNQPFARWDTDRVALWLHVLGLSMYIGNCRRWVKNGEQLLKASNRDLEKELEIHNRFHRKKLQLALQAVTAEKRSPMSDLDHNWVARWLDDIGLPQYKDQFYEARIDGRLLNYLTLDELVQLKVTNAFHHLSFKRAIQVLRMNNFNQTCLIRRPASDDESLKNCPTEAMLWTNHRIMEWLRSIDLSEYAPNLRGSGVHGALMILEPRFGAEVFATLLSIPASKTLLRRHLTTHFVTLVGNTIQMQKRELESRPGYTALAPNQKVKLRRGIFRSDKPEEFICPMDINI